jgi:hypothetical protein
MKTKIATPKTSISVGDHVLKKYRRKDLVSENKILGIFGEKHEKALEEEKYFLIRE